MLWLECGEDLDRLMTKPISQIFFRLGLAVEWNRAKAAAEKKAMDRLERSQR